MQYGTNTMITMPIDGDDDFLDVTSRLWLAQDGDPCLLLIDTFGRLDGNLPLKNRLMNHPRVELASLNLKRPTATGHLSDPVAFAHDYAYSRCHTRFLLSTHVDVFPLHRGVVKFMEDQVQQGCPVVGWGMSPRGPEAERAHNAGEPPPSPNPYSDGVMGMVCTIYDVPALDRVGPSWSLRRGHHEFGLPRTSAAWGWPDTETTLAKILEKHGIEQRFLGRETNYENQENEHWLHARSARLGVHQRHRDALARGLQLCAEWGV